MSKKIVVISASPAVQNTMIFDTFELGQVNRSKRHEITLAGKGVNIARVCGQLGANVQLVTLLDSTTLAEFKNELLSVNIQLSVQEISKPTRVCTTLLSSGLINGTELVQESPILSEIESKKFQQLAFSIVSSMQKDDVLVCAGSIPKGLPQDFYSKLVKTTECHSILDAHGDVLKNALIHDTWTWVKPNLSEWAQAMNIKETGVIKFMKTYRHEGLILLTDGVKPSLLIDDSIYSIKPPTIEVSNPIGSGDAVAPGLAVSCIFNMDPINAVSFALACGASNCENVIPGYIDKSRVDFLKNESNLIKNI